MRKLPKDFAAGMGKYKQNDSGTPSQKQQLANNGVSSIQKAATPPTILNLPGSSSQIPSDGPQSPRAPTQDLDTINL